LSEEGINSLQITIKNNIIGMENNQFKNTESQIKLPLLISIALAGGIFIGMNMGKSGDGISTSKDSGYGKFREIINYVNRDYVDSVNTEELVESAIAHMLENLDPHSVYIPASELDFSRSQLEGEFEGIGIEFNLIKDTIYVVAALSGGPSEKAGIISGDKIVGVDGQSVAGMSMSNKDVFEKLRGKKGTKVELQIKRKNTDDLLVFNVIRDKIPQYSVDVSYMITDEIGYIKVNRFSANTYDEFRKSLGDLNAKGMQKLILDLQDNPGGYMDRAINMVDELLEGNQLIVYTDGKESRYDSEARAYKKGIFEQGPVIVLINEGSASASEIVAGALQDNDRALIVGRRSYGKGLVQAPISLKDGSELRLTISRYYTPSGRSIQRPYKDQGENYRNELVERYNHGEFFSADSIKVNDSLRFYTTKGREVYGGGGITPDVFVSIDTTENSEYLRKLFYSNAIREYTLGYVEHYRKELEKKGFESFYKDFLVTERMLQDLILLGKELNVDFVEKDYNRSKNLLQLHVKAQIARGVWGNEGFYPIYNQTNEIYQEALRHFEEAALLVQK
jgi:carboxyl-terminal processing protease